MEISPSRHEENQHKIMDCYHLRISYGLLTPYQHHHIQCIIMSPEFLDIDILIDLFFLKNVKLVGKLRNNKAVHHTLVQLPVFSRLTVTYSVRGQSKFDPLLAILYTVTVETTATLISVHPFTKVKHRTCDSVR